MRVLSRFVRIMPIGEPKALHAQGWLARAEGKTRQASELFRRSLDRARHYGLPFDEARARVELARDEGLDTEAGRRNLDDAATVFDRLGARWHAEHARQLLDQD